MNNYYELIYLNKYLKESLPGKYFDFAISPHKDVLEIFLKNETDTVRLVFSTNPNETALFLDKFRPPKKSNVIEFFKGLEGEEIVNIELAEHDRLIYIYFHNGMFLLFKLYGGSPNALLVSDGEVIDLFKDSSNLVGAPPPEPNAPVFSGKIEPGATSKRKITSLNPLLPRTLIPRLVEQYQTDRMDDQQLKAFVGMLTAELKENPHPRVLADGETCLWSERILKAETDRSFDTVNGMILHAYRHTVHKRRLSRKKTEIMDVLKRSLAREQNKLEQLENADKSLDRADEYEKFGHLLMANISESLTPGQTEIDVKDFYGDHEGDRVAIPVKGRLSMAENAQLYYKKAREARESFEHAGSRVGNVQEFVGELHSVIRELEVIEHVPELEKWIREKSEVLAQCGYGGGESKQVKSPFRKFKTGKYEIWIGKNAKSNDRLIGIAHKEDIWLHARGVGGSHAVIRMGNQKAFPPKHVILEAASYAAYYSKAKGMKSAPVMYTKVKYVRKPKGADPGAVLVEREQVELVPPQKPNKQ